MRILIVDQCSGSKDCASDLAEIDQERTGELSREEALAEVGIDGIPAKNLYVGKQQRRITEAVDSLTTKGYEVDRYFISAGFGLIQADERLPPYEATFNNMAKAERDERSQRFKLTERIESLVEDEDFSLVFFALGSKYYGAFDLESVLATTPTETAVVLFNQERLATRYENVESVPARTEQGKKFGSTVVGLKGTYLKNFATSLAEDDTNISASKAAEYCTTKPTQSGFDQYS